MNFSDVIGQNHIKSHLKTTVATGRVAHAQLFSGINGSGLLPMAIAYAAELLASHYEKGSAEYEASHRKVREFNHPDLHFFYPVNTTKEVKKDALSHDFAEQWREFVQQNPYASLFEWLQSLGIGDKQGNISRGEANHISKKLSLKSHEGGYKIAIIWMAENMNISCANAILKLIEEPTDKTVLLLLSEREENILTTIKSRCQKISFPRLPDAEIANGLIKKYNLEESKAIQISRRAQGDFNKAIQLSGETDGDAQFESWFIALVRTAFMAKQDKKAIRELLAWTDHIASAGRETQKKFLIFSIEMFRQALLTNYQTHELVYYNTYDPGFSLRKFAPYVHHNNIEEIFKTLEEATYHVERNAHAKILFMDLSIKLTRLLHAKRS